MTIGNGSDVDEFAHGTHARELDWLVPLGMTPTEALRAATVVAAGILGNGFEAGELKVGLLTDVIAVEGDLTASIGALKKVALVMKGGVIYRKPLP
ncbi:MAG: amidohydrolase family protein [Pseudomonadota bacterium]|nr:amidohydrolase family protein [Pseudomonadota bacterium]